MKKDISHKKFVKEFKASTKHALLINEIDDVLGLEISPYYQTIIIKELINQWRKPEIQ